MPLFRVKAANIFEGYKSSSNFHFRDRLKHPKFWFKHQNEIIFIFFVPVAGKYIKDAERDGWEKFNCKMQIINSKPRQ